MKRPYELLTKATRFDVEALIDHHAQGPTEHIVGKTYSRALAVYVNTLHPRDTRCHVAIRRDFTPRNSLEVLTLLIVVLPQGTLAHGAYTQQPNQVYLGWNPIATGIECQMSCDSLGTHQPYFDIRMEPAIWERFVNHITEWGVDVSDFHASYLRDMGKGK